MMLIINHGMEDDRMRTISATLTYPSERIGRPSSSAPCRRSHDIVLESRTSGVSLSRPRNFVFCDGLDFLLPLPLTLTFPFDCVEEWDMRLDCDGHVFSSIDNAETTEGKVISILGCRRKKYDESHV